MKKFSTLAMAALLATSAGGLGFAAPAYAQKDKDAAKGPSFKMSKPVLAIASKAQDAIRAKDVATADTLVGQVESAATTDDDIYIAAALRYDLENTKLVIAQTANPKAPLNESALGAPLDALIAAKSTPAADRGKYIYRRGLLAYNGGQYPTAIDYFNRAKAAGNTDPQIDLLLSKAKLQGADSPAGLADLDATLRKQEAAGTKPTEEFYRFAIANANKQKNGPLTLSLLARYVAAYPTQKNWRQVIQTYGFQKDSSIQLDSPQKIDMFRLLRQTNSLADQFDYEEYASLAYSRGLPTEAQSVIKEGQASGKVPATSSTAKGLLTDSAAAIRSEGSLGSSETKAKSSSDGKLAAQTGDAYLGQGNNAKAIELYTLALSKGGVNADEVNTHLGIAQERSGDNAAANASFDKVQGQPRAGIAQLWKASIKAGSTPAAPAAAS